MYEIYIERSAEKDLRKLSEQYFDKIIAKIKALTKEPRPYGSKKITNSENFWRIRIGTFRVIYEIDDAELKIKIYKVRHRKDVYKK